MVQPARVLTGADVRRLLSQVRCHRRHSRDTAMVLLGFKAGLRACEIAGLDWSMALKPDGRMGSQLLVAPDREGRHRPARATPPRPEGSAGAVAHCTRPAA